MFLDTGFPTSRASANHFMYERVLSNSVPPVLEGEATRAKPNSQEFLNGSRLCGETLTKGTLFFSGSLCELTGLATRARALQQRPRWLHSNLTALAVYPQYSWNDSISSCFYCSYKFSQLFIFALFTLLKWLPSKRVRTTLFFWRRVWKTSSPTAS